MRLLNTTSFELVWCINNIPDYAILSHTWGDEEVTFKDLDSDTGREKEGWSKITNACRYAASQGWEYIWIDTCCIDKSDPTELGEAINSMFSWYESASVCYAYLADVSILGFSFERSRWFTRGWTLQELLAPNLLEFLDAEWKPLGSREDWVIEIEHATGIKRRHLADFRRCCLATKLSWAANRQTTRTEDHAYSLLGLLGVHMPLIYGEGEKAFVRLQQELLRKYNDESILVWHDETYGVPSWPPVISGQYFRNTLQDTHAAILARSPRSFRSVSALETQRFDKARLRFEMTNCGLSINARLFENRELSFRGPLYLIELNCTLPRPTCGTRSPVVLVLRRDLDTRGFVKMGHPLLDRKSVDAMPGTWRDAGRHDILILEGTESLSYYTPDDSTPKYIQYRRSDVADTIGYRHVDIYIASRSTSSLSWRLHPMDARGDIYQPFPLRKNQACICSMFETKYGNAGEYLVIVKWGARAVTCGIWRGPFEMHDILKKLDSDKHHPFPTRARSQIGRTEVRALVLAQANKGPEKCYHIAFRRFPLKPLEENEPENNDPAASEGTKQSTMLAPTNKATQALSSVPGFLSTYSAQKSVDDRPVWSWFDQLLLRNSDLSDVMRTDVTDLDSDIKASDGDSQGAIFRNYSDTNSDEQLQQYYNEENIHEHQNSGPLLWRGRFIGLSHLRFLPPSKTGLKSFPRTQMSIISLSLLGTGTWNDISTPDLYPPVISSSDDPSETTKELHEFYMAPATPYTDELDGLKRKRQEVRNRLLQAMFDPSMLNHQSKRARYELYRNLSMDVFDTGPSSLFPPLSNTAFPYQMMQVPVIRSYSLPMDQ